MQLHIKLVLAGNETWDGLSHASDTVTEPSY
jgi:hypothetical protein